MPSKPFVVSVRALLPDADGRYLTIQRAESSKWNAGKWDLPGGKPDPGESIGDALVREAREETALDIMPIRAVGCSQWELDTVIVVCVFFEVRVLSGAVVLSDEHGAVRWVPRLELLDAGLCEEFTPALREYVAAT